VIVATPDDTTVVTERLLLTALTIEDADEMAGVLGDIRLHQFIDGRPDALDQLRDRYRRWIAGATDPSVTWLNWIVRQRTSMDAIGTIQATVSTKSDGWTAAELAWVIGIGWQGNGFATEAACSIIDWLRDHEVDDITAHIHPDNHASGIVASRSGLHPTDERHAGETVWRYPPASVEAHSAPGTPRSRRHQARRSDSA
jgi:RimJ/RimL family protein N-acetyltransferase